MNRIKSIIRITVLIALTAIGILGVLSSPIETSTSWLRDFILSKAIGFAALFAATRLYPRWEKIDPILRAYDKCIKSID